MYGCAKPKRAPYLVSNIFDYNINEINNNYSNLELIIVDDNSEDNTFQIASMFASDNEHVQVFEMPYDDLG